MKRKELLKLGVGIGLVTALVVGLSLVSGCVPTAQPEVEKVFKFGNCTAFSGLGAPWGWQCQTGYEIAVEDINAAGGIKVGGEYYKVELIPYDNKMAPDLSATITRKAIYDDGVKYLAVMSTDAAIAVADLCKQEKVLMFCPNPGMEGYLGPEFPLNFQTYPETIDYFMPIMQFVSEMYPDHTKLAMIYPDDIKGRTMADEFLARAPSMYTVVDTVFTTVGQTEHRSMLTALLTKEPDIIQFGPGSPIDHGYMIKQARELDYEGLFVMPDLEMDVFDVAGADAVEGSFGLCQKGVFPTEVGKHYEEQYIARRGAMNFWTSYQTYDVLHLLQLAIEKADTFDTTKVAEALSTVTYNGTSGSWSFVPHRVTGGLPRMLNAIVYIGQVQNGEEVPLAYFHVVDQDITRLD